MAEFRGSHPGTPAPQTALAQGRRLGGGLYVNNCGIAVSGRKPNNIFRRWRSRFRTPCLGRFCALTLVWQPSLNPLVNSRPSSHRARMAGRQRLIVCAHAYPSVWSQAAGLLPTLTHLLLTTATGAVHMAANYLTDWPIQDALAADAARGLPVDVVLNRSAYGSPAAATWLTAHGVTVRWAPASPYLHAKQLWVGSTLWIGSMNFSYHGVALNQELSVTVPVPAGYAAWWTALWARSTPT